MWTPRFIRDLLRTEESAGIFPAPPVSRKSATIDLSARVDGCSSEIRHVLDNGKTLNICGFHHSRPHVGDDLLIRHAGSVLRYRCVTVNWWDDPEDGFDAIVTYAALPGVPYQPLPSEDDVWPLYRKVRAVMGANS